MPNVSNILKREQTFVFLITAHLLTLPLPYAFSTTSLLVLLAVSLSSLKFHSFNWDNRYLVLLGFYGLIIGSLLWTIHLKQSYRGIERQLGFLLIPLAFMTMPKLGKDAIYSVFKNTAIGLAGFGVFFLSIGILKYIDTSDTSVFFYHELVSFFDLNAIYVSVWVSISLLFLLFQAKKNRWVLISILILSIFLLLLASKSIIIATGLIGVLGGLKNFSANKKILLITSGLIVLLAILFTNNPIKDRFWVEYESSNLSEVWNRECFTRTYYWTGTGIRLFQIRIFSEMLEEDPIFWKGYGINTSQDKIIEKHSKYNLYKGFYHFNFHNQYIQSLAELGFLGMLFILLFLFVPLRDFFQTKDSLFLVFFIIIAFIFVTESYLWRQRGIFHACVCFGLLVHLRATYNSTNHLEGSNSS